MKPAPGPAVAGALVLHKLAQRGPRVVEGSLEVMAEEAHRLRLDPFAPRLLGCQHRTRGGAERAVVQEIDAPMQGPLAGYLGGHRGYRRPMPEPLVDLPRPGAVIFDLDGTLVDTVGARTRAWLAVFAEERIPARRRQVAELIGSDGRRLAREVAAAAGIMLEPGRDERIDARCGELFAQLNRDPRPLPGVQRLLAELDRAGIPWLIATSSRPEQVAASVAGLGLTRRAPVVDGSRVAHAKPAPDLLLLAASEVGVPPGACWYVGDASWDMLAAVSAGMFPIGVTSGAVSARALREAGAGWVVATLEDLSL